MPFKLDTCTNMTDAYMAKDIVVETLRCYSSASCGSKASSTHRGVIINTTRSRVIVSRPMPSL